jgi:hypothetical protein
MTWRLRSVAPIAVLIAAGLQVALYGQRLTIPELLARGETQSISFAPGGRQQDAPDPLTKTDLIVRATVGTPRSRLSDDQFEVYTDYSLLNTVVLYGPEPALPSRPGETIPPLTLTQRGGRITLNEKTFTQFETALPPLVPGTEGLFVLRLVGDRYHILGDYLGAFQIVGERLIPLVRHMEFGQEYRDATVASAVEKMLTKIRGTDPNR